jgi:sulfoxide reductase heme-binding subunit YedZ
MDTAVMNKPFLTAPRKILLLKSLIHVVALWVVADLYYKAVYDLLGSDPVKQVIHSTGMGALNLLLLTLAASPLAKQFKAGWLMRTRRLLGLYCFFYASLHLTSFAAFELQFDFSLLLSEIIKRPYITVGMVAFSLLLALAITSPDAVKRKLGKSWQKLHNWIYLIAILVPVHFYWSIKSDITEPVIYRAMVFGLLWFRRGKFNRSVNKNS